MKTDPYLEILRDRDPGVFQEIVMFLVSDSVAAAAALAQFKSLPLEVVEALAQSPDATVVGLVVSRPDAPTWLLRRFAESEQVWNRHSALENPSTPADIVALLRSDEALMQWQAEVLEIRNKAKHSVESLPSALDSDRARDIAESTASGPGVLRELFRRTKDDPSAYAIRSALAENPSTPDDLINDLIACAGYRWEWRSLWNRFDFWDTMPSTFMFLSPNADRAHLEALGKAGHPAALLRKDLPLYEIVGDRPRALAELINSELLIRALWRELAMHNVVRLSYAGDSLEGDRFYPYCPPLEAELIDEFGPTQFLVGGWSETREWVSVQEDLSDAEFLWERLSVDYLQTQMESLAEPSDDELDLLMLAAIAAGSSEDLDEVTRLPAADELLLGIGATLIDSDDLDWSVRVNPSMLPEISFGAVSGSQQLELVKLVCDAQAHPIFRQWSISEHFLACMALHPDTSSEARKMLSQQDSSLIQQCLRLSAGN